MSQSTTTGTRIIIIGAGWAGISAAKTYLEIARHLGRAVDLTVLDSGPAPGGVWNPSRLYPGLVAQGLNGFYEFSDLPMANDDHPWGSSITGEYVQEYLQRYSKQFGVFDKIRFGVRVDHIRRRGSFESPQGWSLETSTGEVLSCDKLIYSAGLYSSPKPVPSLPGDSPYTGLSFHTVDLSKHHNSLAEDPSVKDIVVIGGCKSAVEACSVFLPSNKRIHWLVRPAGQGAPMVHFDGDDPSLLAAASTRMFAAFSPSIFTTSGFWYTLLHSGSVFVGSFLVWVFWTLTSRKVSGDVNYDQSENGKKIKPTGGTFFYDAPYVSALEKSHPFLKAFHADDPDLITVYRALAERLQGREMVIRDDKGVEKTIKADAVIWAIGFKPDTAVFERSEAEELGIPVLIRTPLKSLNPPCDKKVRALFPKTLTGEPRLGVSVSQPTHTRWSLYRQIIPAKSFANGDRTLAFSGLVSAGQTPIMCELTALWAVAWLEDLFTSIPRPIDTGVSAPTGHEAQRSAHNTTDTHLSGSNRRELQTAAEKEISLVQAWMYRRTGIRGVMNPDIILECQSYFDVLCRDLGVPTERKKLRYLDERRNGKVGPWSRVKAWFKEYLEPYRADDYKGVVVEFLDNRERLLESRK